MNSLFLELKLLGYPGSFSDYCPSRLDGDGQLSMRDVASAAKQLGFDLISVRATLDDLDAIRQPVLLCMHNEYVNSDMLYYVVFLGFFTAKTGSGTSTVKALVFEGGEVAIEAIPRDRLRREWSGYALVPRRELLGEKYAYCFMVFGLAFPIIILVRKHSLWRHAHPGTA
jgi:hypothetical protein